MTPYDVYRGPPGPPPKWWQKLFVWCVFFAYLIVWLVVVLVCGNRDWLKRPEGNRK